MHSFSAVLCGLTLIFACLDRSLSAQSNEPHPSTLTWTTTSADAAGSMPLGNGSLGVNAWIEKSGDLVFYLSHTDAWSENARLLKLGRVRISTTPNPFRDVADFSWRLDPSTGRMTVTAGNGGAKSTLELFVDADEPIVHVRISSPTPVTATAALEIWRTAEKIITDPTEKQSSWAMRDAPDAVVVKESPDIVLPGRDGEVLWYRRNSHSIVDLTLRHQGLATEKDKTGDPIMYRTMGGLLTGRDMKRSGETSIASVLPTNTVEIRVAATVKHPASADAFLRAVREAAERNADFDAARQRTEAYWKAYWSRSYISVEEKPGEESAITRSYDWSRWMAACAGRGNFPIKFNGSIFTVDGHFAGAQKFDPDWRRWGGDFWWQNTRLPYYAMLARGELAMMRPLFDFYERAMPICEARAKIYYGAEGVYFPETMTMFGTYSNGDYGWNRDGLSPGIIQCPYWQWAWNQGPELVALMLDYFDYGQDREYFSGHTLPTSKKVLAYFDSRFRRDARGKLVISPTQSIETYWKDVQNDLPTVAGLIEMTDRLMHLPADLLTADDRAYFTRMRAACPEIPTRKDGDVLMLSPAEKFDPERSNCETPELYSVFPFKLHGLARPNLDHALAAFSRRIDRATHGWTQDGIFAVRLGRIDDARSNLVEKTKNSHRGYRFPATWGPNFDWLPDQCHASNLMLQLQEMVLQPVGEHILLLPTWPKEWNVDFRLHAPGGVIVEGCFKNGTWSKLSTIPAEAKSRLRTPAR